MRKEPRNRILFKHGTMLSGIERSYLEGLVTNSKTRWFKDNAVLNTAVNLNFLFDGDSAVHMV